jgi:hypothetical protein
MSSSPKLVKGLVVALAAKEQWCFSGWLQWSSSSFSNSSVYVPAELSASTKGT